MKPVTNLLRYPGGKARAAALLFTMLPPQITTSTDAVVCGSPFYGGGSFENHIKNTLPHVSIAASDFFGVLVVFWRVVVEQNSQLVESVRTYHRNGVDKDLFLSLQKDLALTESAIAVSGVDALSDDEQLVTATKFYVVNRCSFSGATLSGGYSKASATQRFTATTIDKITRFDTSRLSVTYADYNNVMNTLDDTCDFVFLDPPYMLDNSDLYGVKGDRHAGFDHKHLASVVTHMDTPWMLTYNDHPEVRKWYKDYHIVDAQWKYGMNASKNSSEIVVMNY